MRIVVCVMLAVLCTVITGFVLMYGWNTFIGPIGVADIGFWQTLGILTMYTILTDKPRTEKVSLDEFIERVSGKIILAIIGFVFMFIYHIIQVN